MAYENTYTDFTWGKAKTSLNKEKIFYNSFFYENEEYCLHDNVMVYDEDQPDGHIAKIMKLWEDIAGGAMMALLRWYLRPCELPKHLHGQLASENSKELFLAFGKGKGVTNENKLDCIEKKCKVLCTSKDARNQQPSEEDLNSADFWYNRIYNVDLKKLSNLEGIVKVLGQDVLFNKQSWLSNKESGNQEKSSFPATTLHTTSANSTSVPCQQPVEDGEVAPESNPTKCSREDWGQSAPLKRTSQNDSLPAKKPKLGSEEVTAEGQPSLHANVKKETISLSSSMPRASQGAAARGSLAEPPALKRSASALSPRQHSTMLASTKKEPPNLLSSVSRMSHHATESSPLAVQPLTRSAISKRNEQSLIKAKIDAKNAIETTATGRTSFADSEPHLSFLIPTRVRSKQVQHQESTLTPKSQLSSPAESMNLGRLLLIQNIDSSINLKDMNDMMKYALEGCSSVQMLQRSGSLCSAAGEALLVFDTEDLADDALKQFEENCLVIAGCTSPLIARKIALPYSGKIARFPGHFPLDNFKPWKQRQEEIMKKSFENFRFADAKSVEFEMASEWRNLHMWLGRCWEQLYKVHGEEINMVSEKYKKPKLRVP